MNYLLENKTDNSGGGFTITDERKEVVDFSYPTLFAGTSLVVSREKRKLLGKFKH